MLRKILCFILTLIMMFSFTTNSLIFAEENKDNIAENEIESNVDDIKEDTAENSEEKITVYLTVSNKGVLSEDSEGEAMVNREVVVTDIDKDGKFTFHEALIAAHKEYNSEDGYDAGSGNGVSVVKLWGVDSYNNLFL